MSRMFETATLAAGCFWCVEAIFKELKGVHSVTSGYTGGTTPNPTYKQVCGGKTGHAEAVQIAFDPEVIAFEDLLFVFWRMHDPTTLDRQGADVGTQYRSAIFFHSHEQKETAERSKREAGELGLWPNPIVTEITPFTNFSKAEEYHQDYYQLNSYQPYCQIVIEPKLRKFRKEFQSKLGDHAG